MEVILKKSKITNAILKQTQRSTSIDFNVGVTLGWVYFNKTQYMIIYRSDLNNLSMYLLFKHVVSAFHQSSNKWTAEVVFDGNYAPHYYEFNTQEERDLFVTTIKKSMAESIRKGQFFI